VSVQGANCNWLIKRSGRRRRESEESETRRREGAGSGRIGEVDESGVFRVAAGDYRVGRDVGAFPLPPSERAEVTETSSPLFSLEENDATRKVWDWESVTLRN
jgi:hypothetical protein